MPSREEHNFLNSLILGNKFDNVNEIVDKASKYLGSSHRSVGHDRATLVALYLKDPAWARAGYLHQVLDFNPRLADFLAMMRFANEGKLPAQDSGFLGRMNGENAQYWRIAKCKRLLGILQKKGPEGQH